MNIAQQLKSGRIYLDGGMGTLLQQSGLGAGELPERWNITHPDTVTAIHKAYFDAGSNIVNTNTFGANSLKFDRNELENIISSAIKNADTARRSSKALQNKYIALDIGPLGKLLKPYGDLEFEDAVSVFADTVKIGVKYGADLIFIETMNDCYETKAALLAAKENSELPIFVSNSYSTDGTLMTGATPEAMVAMLEGMGADAIGLNCSMGPADMKGVIEKLLSSATVPILVKPNAGLPFEKDGKTVFSVTAQEFAKELKEIAEMGVNILGGCCGTTPEYIKQTVNATADLPFVLPEKKEKTVVSSGRKTVEIGTLPVIIGERINPTGKPRFKQAIRENDMDVILREGIAEQESGAHILDVNVGLPDIDEKSFLKLAVEQLQAVTDLPLQIDTSDVAALENALRIYNGKAMINSVNGSEESMKTVFPLVKKYGGVVVALTLDENGIPDSAQGRIEIAEKILHRAKEYGIEKKDIVFDTLCMSVATDSNAAKVTLSALGYINKTLKVNTVLGISNISFGLPDRDAVNAQFLSLALKNGLSAAIVNPFSLEIIKTYRTYKLLMGMDKDCADYIAFTENILKGEEKPAVKSDTEYDLKKAIIKGLKDRSGELCTQMLKSTDALEIIDGHIIPALDTVGVGFENKTVYLPQLLMSAEAAKSAFEVIKQSAFESGVTADKKGKFVLATVKGDIHDIGKNIVKVLLQNYGFEVIDLGRDVPPEKIVETVKKEKAALCGLSALMTTTVPAMEETVKLLKADVPECKIIVGGAVLTKEYAEKIGADKYAKDAMATVRYAEQNL